MFDLKLFRAIYADRQREIDRMARQRRLRELVVVRPSGGAGGGSGLEGRRERTNAAGDRALDPAG